jgi:hypothetical protein
MRRRPSGLVAALALAVAVAVVVGCGSSPAPTPRVAASASASAARPAISAGGVPPTLAASAVPYLPSRRKLLTASFLARETQAPGLTRQLGAWGYVAGADRYFQGESRRLQVVDSRTLRFRRASSAAAFVGFMRTHLTAFLGSFPKIHRFVSGSRRGLLAAGQGCRCHLANPTYLALVARGGTVTWLEINGPGATRGRLAALVAQAP